MAKVYITTEPDGTFRVRAERLAGKTLAAHKTVRGIKRGELAHRVEVIMEVVAPRKKASGIF